MHRTYLLLGLPDQAEGDLGADIADALDARIDEVEATLFVRQGVRETEGGGLDHAVRHGGHAGKDRAEADTGEDVHVVALAGVQHAPVVLLLGEGRAGREDDLAVGPLDGLVELALGETDGVGEGEDDGALVELGHLRDDGLVEGTLANTQRVSDTELAWILRSY